MIQKTMANILLSLAGLICFLPLVLTACEDPSAVTPPETPEGVMYPKYGDLVMAGYQGWFNTPSDGANRNWHHYGFEPADAPAHTNVDFWPDMAEYVKRYEAPFKMPGGAAAYLYSPYDEESVDLHFKWMREYGIDGVFMQRFVMEINNPSGKNHFNTVLQNALQAARKYGRAIGVMYDLSGCDASKANDAPSKILGDWAELQSLFSLGDPAVNPTYIWHNGRPLLTIWGVGFNDNRKYTTGDVRSVAARLKDAHGVSIMLGVPYYWRDLEGDTEEDPALHALIRDYADIIMPWAVGRYGEYGEHNRERVAADIQWCGANKADYVPLVFPGFSWGNMHNDPGRYNQIPRLKGDFLWSQIAGVKSAGARSLYVAMFDEIDEGTAIFKCALEGETPLFPGGVPGSGFVGFETGLNTDYYLWLVGQGAEWIHGNAGYSSVKPVRSEAAGVNLEH